MGLPGVKVGPLDPDATSSFGRVAQGNSARQLIRLHRQQFPPELLRARARPRDDARTKALDLDEVGGHVSRLIHQNGDPVIPEGAKIVGAAVRGEAATGRVLTFSYELPSGRVGKWFTPYNEDVLPNSFVAGEELSKVKEMRDRGLVAYDSEGTHREILQRQNSQLAQENERLRAYIDSGGDGEVPSQSEVDTRKSVVLADENERLGRENQEMRERLAQFEALHSAGGGSVPTGGIEETAHEPTVAEQDPPFEGYEDLKAEELVNRIKADETTPDERRAILEYESKHANRRSVVSAAEQALDRE